MSSQYLRDPISKLWVLTSLKLRTEFPEQANPHKVVWTQFSGALGILERFIKQMLNFPPGGSDYHSSKEIHSKWLLMQVCLLLMSHRMLPCKGRHPAFISPILGASSSQKQNYFSFFLKKFNMGFGGLFCCCCCWTLYIHHQNPVSKHSPNSFQICLPSISISIPRPRQPRVNILSL